MDEVTAWIFFFGICVYGIGQIVYGIAVTRDIWRNLGIRQARREIARKA